MRRLWILLNLFSVSLCLTGCGLVGGSNNSGSDPFSITNAFASIQAGGAPVTLAAASSSSPEPVDWSLTFANQGCSPACGTLTPFGNTSATYTPPAESPNYGTATITAALKSSPSTIFAFNFQITPGLSVNISNKFSSITAGGSQVQINATVTGDSANGGVTWALTAGGNSCSPACGTLTPSTGSPVLSAVYVPPATLPTGASASPTISATSVTKSSKSDNFTFSIVTAFTRLKGSYSLLLRGYDLAGSPMSMAGSVTADGQGNITAGEFDANNGGGITRIAGPLMGSYSIDPSFNNVTRGRIVITNYTYPGTNIGIAFDFTLSADGKGGRAVESDGTGYINSGTLLQQDSVALTAANPSGTYAFGLDSDSPVGGRTVEAGRFVLAAGAVTGGIADQSTAGNLTPTYAAEPITGGSATAPDSSGRGTLTLTVKGNSSTFAYYIVNSTQLNLLQIDRALTFGTVQAGVAYVQKMPFSADSVNTTSVLQMTGMDTVPGTTNKIGPDVIIGVLKISGGNQFTLTFDENDLGTVLPGHPANGNVFFDPTTGRGTFSDVGGFENAFMDASVFYLYDAGKAFIIDADISTCAPPPAVVPPSCVISSSPATSITNNAFSGTFTTQASGPFNASAISGNLILGSGATVIPDIPDIETAVTANPADGTFAAVTDLDSLLTQSANLRNYSFSGTFAIKDPTLGVGAATLPAFIFGDFVITPTPASFYMIAPNQFVLIGMQPGLYSGISYIDPQ
ncbi:MAG TPA: hypothetical protein VK709_03305 [Candidatus Saccharimonadales bacterium]|nr:hypothetical protein [Candidatus Saccharimonadales bacterium]